MCQPDTRRVESDLAQSHSLPRDSYVGLNDGHKMPVLGFGTYAPEKSLAEEGTKEAIDVGYRHIDCAFIYGSEVELWSMFHTPERVRLCLEKSLNDLQLDYLDLFIIHTPVEFKALEECKDSGLVRSIGVFNFNHKQLELILNMPGGIYLNQSKLLEFCKSNGGIQCTGDWQS
ncbi:hypothetical protein XELAEV_18002496mg [Xenopus laevis]|nr:hypothetical protein XELAEV_18002496mg [Xenopus laevis]